MIKSIKPNSKLRCSAFSACRIQATLPKKRHWYVCKQCAGSPPLRLCHLVHCMLQRPNVVIVASVCCAAVAPRFDSHRGVPLNPAKGSPLVCIRNMKLPQSSQKIPQSLAFGPRGPGTLRLLAGEGRSNAAAFCCIMRTS